MKYLLAHFFLVVSSLRLFAADSSTYIIGCGEPGLGIIYDSSNEWVVLVDQAAETSWKPGDALFADFRDRPLKIIAQINFGPEKLSPTRSPVCSTENLFPFDEKTVFTSFGDPQSRKGFIPRQTKVFSVYAEPILISHDVDVLARARYGLTTNQWFLGKVGTNIFYLGDKKPNIVFFRNDVLTHAAPEYFKLPKAVHSVYGVTKAISPNKDIGIFAIRKLSWYELGITSEVRPVFIELSFADAKTKKK